MERWVAKLLCLFGSFILPLVCTVLPYKVSGCIASRGATGKRVLSYLMCLGGGIFFGTYLLHMGPEVQQILTNSLLKPYNIHYPLAELVVGIGFFIVLFAEKFVLRWNKRRLRHKRQKCIKAKQAAAAAVEANGIKCARPSKDGMCPECFRGEPCSALDDHDKNNVAIHVHSSLTGSGDNTSSARLLSTNPPTASSPVALSGTSGATSVVDIEDLSKCATTVIDGKCSCRDCCSDALLPVGSQEWSHREKEIIITMKVENCKTPIAAEVVQLKHTHDEDDDDDDDLSEVGGGGHHHATRSIILILALSLHRIFEGMSIGLQHSVTNVASLFGAVMCHETVIGFSLGLQFVKSGFALRRLVVTSVVCSCIMPVGVLIGLAMTEFGRTSDTVDIANGLLQAIAMGTFIYVTFFEILQEEVDPEDTSLAKIVFIAIGFTLMALLDLIPEEMVETSLTPITSVFTTAMY